MCLFESLRGGFLAKCLEQLASNDPSQSRSNLSPLMAMQFETAMDAAITALNRIEFDLPSPAWLLRLTNHEDVRCATAEDMLLRHKPWQKQKVDTKQGFRVLVNVPYGHSLVWQFRTQAYDHSFCCAVATSEGCDLSFSDEQNEGFVRRTVYYPGKSLQEGRFTVPEQPNSSAPSSPDRFSDSDCGSPRRQGHQRSHSRDESDSLLQFLEVIELKLAAGEITEAEAQSCMPPSWKIYADQNYEKWVLRRLDQTRSRSWKMHGGKLSSLQILARYPWKLDLMSRGLHPH